MKDRVQVFLSVCVAVAVSVPALAQQPTSTSAGPRRNW